MDGHQNKSDGIGFRNVIEELVNLVSSDEKFTDIYIEAEKPVMLLTPRGWVAHAGIDPLYEEDLCDLFERIDEDWRHHIKIGAIGRALDLSDCRLRIDAYQINNCRDYAISIRRQPLVPIPFRELGLPMYLRTVLEYTKGLIIVSGQTGSGKTTTLASMVDYINERNAAHIITIEDPIEYVHVWKKSIITHKEVPNDVETFSKGLKEALRQKPDVILVGEIRDRETAEVLMQASESGHLVLCSLHTNSAIGAIKKLASFFPQDEIHHRLRTIADSLLMIVCQNLVPSADDKSFVLAAEILMNLMPTTAKMIEDPGKHAQLRQMMTSGQDQESRTLNSDLKRLIAEGQITEKAAQKVTNDRMELTTMLASVKR